VNLEEPLLTISSALAEPPARSMPIGPGRWHVLFGGRQRPLLVPASRYHLQERCLQYFVGGGLKALYARTLLKLNALVPTAGLLPEFRLPPPPGSGLPCDLSLHEPSHAAIQIGTEGPYQKASMLLVSDGGDGLALAKVAMVPTADRMVGVEARWLKNLEQLGTLSGQVPRLLAEGRALNGRRYLVTDLAPSTQATSAFTPAHARFLGALGRTRVDTARFSASACREWLERTLGQVEPCVTRDERETLRQALRDCEAALADFAGPFVLAQGDFAPWNIRLHGEGLFVFDWEYARAGANALADVFNYFFIPRAVSGRPIGRRRLAAVLRRAEALARQLHPEWAWSPRAVSGLALAYLLEVLLCYSRASQRVDWAHPVIRSYWRLAERRARWMAT
jgi:hypothetical protein